MTIEECLRLATLAVKVIDLASKAIHDLADIYTARVHANLPSMERRRRELRAGKVNSNTSPR